MSDRPTVQLYRERLLVLRPRPFLRFMADGESVTGSRVPQRRVLSRWNGPFSQRGDRRTTRLRGQPVRRYRWCRLDADNATIRRSVHLHRNGNAARNGYPRALAFRAISSARRQVGVPPMLLVSLSSRAASFSDRQMSLNSATLRGSYGAVALIAIERIRDCSVGTSSSARDARW
jgi:hypothetical protein